MKSGGYCPNAHHLAVGRLTMIIPFLQTAIGDLKAPREPDFRKVLRITDELVDDLGSKRHAGNEGVQIEREEFWRTLLAFPVEIIELVFHYLQEISGGAPPAP